MTGDRARGWMLVAVQAVLLAVLVLSPRGEDWSVPPWLEAVGVAGRAVGATAIVLGAVRLGVAASVHPAPTARATLRTTGLYRFARHPIYTGVLVLAAAIMVTGGSTSHVGAFLALVALLTVKARFEERLLTERFPEYPTYAARTHRFLPLPARPGAPRRLR